MAIAAGCGPDPSTATPMGTNPGESGDGGPTSPTPLPDTPKATECTAAPTTVTHASNAEAKAPLLTLRVDTSAPGRERAVCNDGSAAAYTFRAGSSKRFILYLDGGGWCSTPESCLSRRRAQFFNTSTDGLIFPADFDGILSADAALNPDFYDASSAYIHYCSSDSWSGDRGPLQAGDANLTTDAWHFRGRAIVKAVIDELVGAQRLGPSSEVLLVGSSAGGFGAATIADDVAGWLPPGTRYAVVSDASLFIDAPPFDLAMKAASTTEPSFILALLTGGVTLWQGSGAKHCPQAANDPRCRHPEHLLRSGWVHTPLLLSASLVDPLRLRQNQIPLDDRGDPTTEAAPYLADLEAKARLAASTFAPRYSQFLSLGEHHVVANRPLFTTVLVAAFPPATAYGDFFRDPCTAQRRVAPP